ncbi:mitochondrial 37S ribosomal protein mS35 [Aspergillus clavatus NRRL 1]|uniref:37S ribosomal protein Rsm24, putative n=1 Tax=Aspergillus clavatus (strain ATCC 1007 / CBS 513.65 / DSM 816 / NCTC 3887 / NRRL 1 / QM 1276 / 107) TaxID=344612 RepID=A1CIR2_ASPCL|nr:37S ribosomal protein Rsm24, putative [Aspergillus clavatus NRRL 1]EAW10767.1 37S ribosomal protein Rsm24, putative [Aspergillus clavatus NRRL 1]
MASVARFLGRSAFSFARRRPVAIQSRSFAVTPLRFLPEDPPVPQERELSPEDYPDMPDYSPDMLSKEERSMYDMLSPEERELFDAEQRRLVQEFNDHSKRAAAFAEIDKSVRDLEKEVGLRFEDLPEKNKGFWAEEEDDEFALVEDGDEDFHDDEITSMAHAEVELHREIREYARITAWDMPLLSKLAQPFTLPPETHILRFRYTTYMGEQHPAEAKVVVEVASKDLVPKHLSEAQRQTFLKLVGPRYNPDTDIVRMSCEKFTTRAENKRYLGDLINTLVKEAKEGDSFADIPLDLRHHKPKRQLRFPESWVMTEERKKQLAARRRERLAREQERQSIVDGNAVVALASRSLPSLNPALSARAAEEREKVAVKLSGKGMKKRVR